MDSEESRPGSSASNSSTNSSENSRQSLPIPSNDEKLYKSPTLNSVASPQSSGGLSRPRSRSYNEDGRSPRSPSKSDSDSSSSSSSSDNENDEPISLASGTQAKSKGSTDGSSSSGSIDKQQLFGSQNQSPSPVKSRPSSRNSSYSSNHSHSNSHKTHPKESEININHEDLSDVSDMESEKRVFGFNNTKPSLEDDETNTSSLNAAPILDTSGHELEKLQYSPHSNIQEATITDLRHRLEQKKNQLKGNERVKTIEEKDEDVSNGNTDVIETIENLVKTHDEDALDFEAEEGECQDISKDGDNSIVEETDAGMNKTNGGNSDGEAEDDEELEEGEVSDEDEKRPEETEPKPVCRFYTRGQCTWGMSCRFLHPGVTDKGNYTMFDLVRPVSVSQNCVVSNRPSSYSSHGTEYHDYRTERPQLHHRVPIPAQSSVFTSHHEPRVVLPEGPVVVESAWERGLRTAKEMMRKANKRKEQDMDFEDKKMNLTLSPDELGEKDSYYLKDRVSPQDTVPPFGRHGVYQEVSGSMYSPPERFGRGPPIVTYDEVDPYGRTTRYRELPPHRMPQYEDERRVRPTREVIVQRVEPVGRGDEWNDPWMRSKSPGGRASRDRVDKRRRDRRSYSSNSSYSSSSSSQTDTSSDSSRSASPAAQRRRYNSSQKSSPPVRRHDVRSGKSPSSPKRRSRQSPSTRQSSVNKRRGHISSPPGLERKSGYSPVHKHKKQLTTKLKKTLIEKSKAKRRQTTSSSDSGSSDSSASDSGSDTGSSTTDSSSRSIDHTPKKRTRIPEKPINNRKLLKKVEPPNKRSPISIEIKKAATVGTSALTSPTHSISSEKDSKKSRREELLKQLRAVEDAIAKKRSKLV